MSSIKVQMNQCEVFVKSPGQVVVAYSGRIPAIYMKDLNNELLLQKVQELIDVYTALVEEIIPGVLFEFDGDGNIMPKEY